MAELRAEREHVANLYARLDAESSRVADGLRAALADSSATDSQARWQRQVTTENLAARATRLRHAENGLCFGRLDGGDGVSYVGRIGLFDEDDDHRALLLDWRAPAARRFYCATAANPEGVARRRHFRTSGRAVEDFHDDFLDSADPGESLLASVNAPRTGTMRDVVATIQAEQDDIIRLDHRGALVIEGGPGTGKTAVALHRVAYLLYTERERMSRRGALVVGPSPAFLRYVGNVLPSLGETDVLFATPGDLVPGLRATREDSPRACRVKGGLHMVGVLAAAVADRQEIPDEPIEIELDDVTVVVDRGTAESARRQGRATGLLHNRARPCFREALLSGLVEQAVDRIGEGWLEPEDRHVRAELAAEVRFELAGSTGLRDMVDRLWPELTPERLLGDLFGSRERLDAAAGDLDPADRAALFRADPTGWTVSDVPLLDEAVEFLGQPEEAETVDDDEQYARDVLTILDTDEDPDSEVLRAVDLVSPEALAERFREADHRTTAERASTDREWTFGHVVVDEAQELSEMDWRVLMRRCPSRSFTIVGDLAQRRSSAGTSAWADVLDRYVPRRWTHRRLSVNYRTSAEIMAVAADVLAEAGLGLEPPESVRSTGIRPAARCVAPERLPAAVEEASREGEQFGGTVAVVAPEGVVLDLPVNVRAPRQVKGMEYDAVIVVEPGRILAEDGASGLYVALTRATRWLHVLHTEPLPPCLRRLEG